MLKKTLKKIVAKTREKKREAIKRPCVRVCRWLWLRRQPVSAKS